MGRGPPLVWVGLPGPCYGPPGGFAVGERPRGNRWSGHVQTEGLARERKGIGMTTAQFPEQPAPLFERPPVPAHPSWCVCGHGGCQGGDRSTWTTIADARGSDGDTTDWPIADSAGYLACGC